MPIKDSAIETAAQSASRVVRQRLGAALDRADVSTALVLGSGMGKVVQSLGIESTVDYAAIKHFPQPTVEGHGGKLHLCRLPGDQSDRRFLVLQGRFHLYEGVSAAQCTLPVRMLHHLGVGRLVLTNAAGAISAAMQPGDFMVLRDQINFTGTSPLVGANLDAYGERFPAMTALYSKALRETLLQVARHEGVTLHQGVYVGVLGPQYETPAEIEMFRRSGADAVGMSTVLEAIVAGHQKMQLLGLSMITNRAAAVDAPEPTHAEVLALGEAATDRLAKLLQGFLQEVLT